MLLDLYTKRLPWTDEVSYEIKKNTNYYDFYKKRDYFVSILLTMMDNIENSQFSDFYKMTIDELSRTVDYCKSQGK